MNEVELLAPAGNFETALAAFEAGADAVYCGLTEFSARAFADNFGIEELKNLLRYCRSGRSGTDRRPCRRVYVTFNTVIDEDNLEAAIEQLARLDEVRPDALIVQDLGVARICRKHFPGLELHASTQLVAHNLEGVLAMKDLGFKRVVLARELSLEEITSIAKRCGDMELEVFIHGALCYSISGLCLFGAMEKGRSGNRGKCPYCCRVPYGVVKHGFDGSNESDERPSSNSLNPSHSCFPFSMKDLRLGEDVRKLADAGIASLKIEGRMKSALYVASVTRYYRDILDGNREQSAAVDRRRRVAVADLETVFSRRTTKLYFDGRAGTASVRQQEGTASVRQQEGTASVRQQEGTASVRQQGDGRAQDGVIDSESLGHLGAEIGVVKRVTKDREGLSWLRFHTARGLEKHDGLQFEAMVDGKHVGMGIVEMRQAISRRPVFEVNAGVDVEVLLPHGEGSNTEAQRHRENVSACDLAKVLRPGMKIYCSMSNAVKRMFPAPSFRPSDYEGGTQIDVVVTLGKDGIAAYVRGDSKRTTTRVAAEIAGKLQPAKNPEKTVEGVRKAFSKLGGSDYRLGRLTVNDPEKLFAPMSLLNDLRRDLVEKLDEAREKTMRGKVEKALADEQMAGTPSAIRTLKRVKIRAGQKVPAGEWDEVVVGINADFNFVNDGKSISESGESVRWGLPVYTAEPEFNKLRVVVKQGLRAGQTKWEASDLATLRMLKGLGVTDITADWTLYAFNSRALAELSEMGVKRFVASPENNRENLQYLAESGYDVEFLTQQSTPLFVSLTQPAGKPEELAVFKRDGLWITTKKAPRTFEVPGGSATRVDLSWDLE